MTTEKNFVFFRDCNSAGESNVLLNYSAEVLQLEISGDLTASFDIEVVGQLTEGNKYSTCGVIGLTDLLVYQHINKTGIFSCPITGISKIKVKINSISGGKIDIFGRTLS